jgi:hypothetical protein
MAGTIKIAYCAACRTITTRGATATSATNGDRPATTSTIAIARSACGGWHPTSTTSGAGVRRAVGRLYAAPRRAPSVVPRTLSRSRFIGNAVVATGYTSSHNWAVLWPPRQPETPPSRRGFSCADRSFVASEADAALSESWSQSSSVHPPEYSSASERLATRRLTNRRRAVETIRPFGKHPFHEPLQAVLWVSTQPRHGAGHVVLTPLSALIVLISMSRIICASIRRKSTPRFNSPQPERASAIR